MKPKASPVVLLLRFSAKQSYFFTDIFCEIVFTKQYTGMCLPRKRVKRSECSNVEHVFEARAKWLCQVASFRYVFDDATLF